jgi:hypothetical protein
MPVLFVGATAHTPFPAALSSQIDPELSVTTGRFERGTSDFAAAMQSGVLEATNTKTPAPA